MIQVAKNKDFAFDAVFGPNATQREVYEQTAGDTIRNNLFKGFNVTVLACKCPHCTVLYCTVLNKCTALLCCVSIMCCFISLFATVHVLTRCCAHLNIDLLKTDKLEVERHIRYLVEMVTW